MFGSGNQAAVSEGGLVTDWRFSVSFSVQVTRKLLFIHDQPEFID